MLALACLSPQARAEDGNWYERSFFLLHLDHHTTAQMEVGRDADPDETARLINLIKPDVIQIHAKGNPGWTTYPSKVGHTPPKLARDVMQVWTDIAHKNNYVFSAYYNLGRDREIMTRHPEWNRVNANGTPQDNALCYHSGVAEQYLWPMIDEIMTLYRPAGFWFDGSCFTVANCYCAKCRERFRREQNLEAPATPQAAGWAAYKEMQRRIYRDLCAQTAARIKQRDPNCLVAINWAYAWRMPEEPPPGVDYFTGDHGTLVDDIAPDAIWYDSHSKPFDLMMTVFYLDSKGTQPKPRVQLEQEMGIIIAHGGRYFAWDYPTPESALVAERCELMARVATPFLRARQAWCLGSRALPDVALFQGAAAQYAQGVASPSAFPRSNPPLLAACEGLRRQHLSPEMISDRRLELGEIRGRLLVLEDTCELTEANRLALRRYVENGGRVLLTGRAVAAAQLADARPTEGLSRQPLGKGEVFSLPQPWFASTRSPGDVGKILQQVLPTAQRRLTTDAPETVEVLLREKGGEKIIHLVNIAPGTRERDPKANGFVNLQIRELPPAPACRVSLRIAGRPSSVTLQPQNTALADWTWSDGQLQFTVPTFATHQMVVVDASAK